MVAFQFSVTRLGLWSKTTVGICLRCLLAESSEVAEDLVLPVPVHRGRSLLVPFCEGPLFGLRCSGTQAQAALQEWVQCLSVILIRDLKHRTYCTYIVDNLTHQKSGGAPQWSTLTWMLMSELLNSDWVAELLEDWDAELPLVRDFGELVLIGASATVMFTIDVSAGERSAVGEGSRRGLSLIGSSTETSVKEK